MILTKSTLDRYEDWLADAHENGGTLLIDKEKDWTSFDVVAKLRGIVRLKKIGHAGTLDPLATGLLIVCVGKATKTIDHFQGMPKVYKGVIKLGATTRTDDAEAAEENIRDCSLLSNENIEKVVQSFIGDIEQIPPMFSAIKKNGVPLYKLARKGKEIEREPRRVTIESITITDVALPCLHIEVLCSKGTYIRSLARDIGEKLGCGGYLLSLRRTAIGLMNVDEAVHISDIQEARKRLSSSV